jgi:uncharacterized protein (DUF488 family)
VNPELNELIYTLGTSTRTVDEFIKLLISHNVEVVVDVRRFPTSRFRHFCREELQRLLPEAGIGYVYMGDQLGGYRLGGYQNFTATVQFQTGINKLEEIAHEKRAAVMCAERFPWRCHRRFIALELEKRGSQVRHIIDKGKDWVPSKHSANGRQVKLA